jgi:hypothetical protein
MNITLLCIASEDYLEKYKKCIASQKNYCRKHNYTYYLDTNSNNIQHWKDWYWKKIISARQLLPNVDYLVIIDSDCEITDIAEPIESVIDINSVYYVNGISGRPNSGFLIIKNDDIGNNFINNVLDKRSRELPQNFQPTKGENGQVIWELSENSNNTKELPLKWNCSQPEFLKDAYIIHYTNKMKKYFEAII